MPLRAAFRSCFFCTSVVLGLAPCADLFAQSNEYRLDAEKGWTQERSPEANSDEEIMAKARKLLAREEWSEARDLLTKWIEENEIGRGPMVAEAYLLRGDAHVGRDREEDALRDYEEITREYPSSEAFPIALEREFDIAHRYLNGLRRRTFGMRIDSGTPWGEEIMLRINERLPGSRLGERALLELADYYYRERDLRSAADTYDVFLSLYPKSEFREKAMQRRVYANIARFKGPKYDASGLIDAKIQIERFSREFPAEAEKAGMSDALVARLDESAAAQMLDTARWYVRRGDGVGARLQCRKLLERYPASAASQRAMEMMDAKGWKLQAPFSQNSPGITAPAVPAGAKDGQASDPKATPITEPKASEPTGAPR